MKKIVITFGLISGAISSAMMFGTLPLMNRGIINFKNGEVIGYTTMFLSFLLIFFGIRAYRENVGGGTISYGRGLGVGLLIMVISCLCYVASWEIIYFNIAPDFGEKYGAYVVDQLRAKGATPAAIEAKQKEMAKFKEEYDNPLFNAAITFLEPLPVGLIMSLISAGILRRKPSAPPAAAAALA